MDIGGGGGGAGKGEGVLRQLAGKGCGERSRDLGWTLNDGVGRETANAAVVMGGGGGAVHGVGAAATEVAVAPAAGSCVANRGGGMFPSRLKSAVVVCASTEVRWRGDRGGGGVWVRVGRSRSASGRGPRWQGRKRAAGLDWYEADKVNVPRAATDPVDVFKVPVRHCLPFSPDGRARWAQKWRRRRQPVTSPRQPRP